MFSQVEFSAYQLSVIKKASMDDDDPIVHEVCIYFRYLPIVMYSHDIVSHINMCSCCF